MTYKMCGDDLYVYLYGEFDDSVAKTIRENIDMLIDSFVFSRLVIDMRDVSFMDSTGIGVLLGRYKKLRSLGRKLSVKNVNFQVDKVFSMCGIYDIVSKL